MLTFKKRTNKFKRFIFFSFLIMMLSGTFIYLQAVSVIPNQLLIINGKEYICDFKVPFTLNFLSDKKVDLKLNGNKINKDGMSLNMLNSFTLYSGEQKDSHVNLNIKMFGLIPIKTIMLNIVPDKKVIPCGNSIGVRIHTEGVLVVGTTKVFAYDGKYYEPFKSSGIEIGDYIIKLNDTKISNINQVTSIMEKTSGKQLKIQIKRGAVLYDTVVNPCKSKDGKYRIGVWLRDSTAGIGTMTFFDNKNGIFGALGHGITDVDSGTLMSINNGEIVSSYIISVKKGYKGNPGELKGALIESKGKGKIIQNTDFGIYGKINSASSIVPRNKPISIALRNDIKEGPAQIITSINGCNINVYNVDIQKVFRQSTDSTKNMIIKITDERLLNLTGGIVQGMSGSPIIQNGKLIGAVTHVLINDPTRGYGVFIESMIQKSQGIFNNVKLPSAS